MGELTSLEHAHLKSFVRSRPSWTTLLLSERIYDELESGREHKYPRSHPYLTGMQYVLQHLRELAPCSVLDIGSPLAQNVAAACMPGVNVTVLDVRPHDDAEMLGLTWRNATATELPFAAASWSVVTSLWVMGHVGDGRYGDALEPDGDLEMVAEISRVLCQGGTAIIGPGLVDAVPGNIFNLHRIYTWPWLREAFDDCGFDVLDEQDLHVSQEWFIEHGDGVKLSRRDGCYALALLKKR